MKSSFSPDRIIGSIEPLEARIAPASLFIGDRNFNNVLDVEYIEKNKQPGQTLFFVNTSAESADPAQAEGDPVLKASDKFSQILDGVGVGTYYLNLKQGDTVFRFTDNGYKELVRVTGGSVLVCSLTTIVGYASLMVSDNQAIRGFGIAALIGEITCVTAALTLVPAIVAVGRRGASDPLRS